MEQTDLGIEPEMTMCPVGAHYHPSLILPSGKALPRDRRAVERLCQEGKQPQLPAELNRNSYAHEFRQASEGAACSLQGRQATVLTGAGLSSQSKSHQRYPTNVRVGFACNQGESSASGITFMLIS